MKKNKNLEMSLEWPIVKSFLLLTLPILFANLLQSAYQLTDAFWVWRLGWDAVASVSISFPITFFMISLGAWFAVAGSTFIAQYAGAKNQKMVNHVAAQTLLMVVVVSVVIWAIWYVISPNLLSLMWVSKWVYADALSFLRISFIGMIFVFAFSMFQSIMRWLWEVKMPMNIVLFTVLLNLIVDPFFIFWFWFIPAMWVSWAAMATLVTQWIAAIMWLIILLKWKYWIHLNMYDFKPDFWYIKKAFYIGLPSSIEMSARSFGMLIMIFLITSFWTLAVASYWAAWNIFQLIMIFGLWLSMAWSVLIGQNLGAKNIVRADKIGKVSLILSFLVLSFIGIIVFFTAPYLISFFVPGDAMIIERWARILVITALSFGLIWIQMSVNWVLRASWNMKTSLILTLVSQWVVQFPLAYILSKHSSLWVDWIWYAMLITNFIMASISIWVYMKWDWKKNNLISKEEKMKEQVFDDALIEEWIR